MTIQGAIAELQNLLDADDVPLYYKGGIEKVIETIQMEMADRKTESQRDCDNCKRKGYEGCEQPCLGCGWCDLYEPKTEPTISKMEQVDKDINVRSKESE